MRDILRHVAACDNAVLPGDRLALCIRDTPVGWVTPDTAGALLALPNVRMQAGKVVLDEARALPGIAAGLAEAGLCRWRGEAFDVRAVPGGTVLTTVDRGALPLLGLLSFGVHLNGLVRRVDGWWLWVGRRAPDKALDPDKLDNVVAGGIAAGMSAWDTLVKEAAEEARLPAALLREAREVGRIDYAMERAEGLRRDHLICYDVVLPEDFTPAPGDDEVVAFELWPIVRALEAVRETDKFKFNVNLVLIDLFRRLRLLA